MKSFEKYGIIILAAGSSSRLGRPKQLLSFHGQNLLENTITVARGTGIPNIVVVLGSEAQLIKENTNNFGVAMVYNPDWEDGMSSSIKCGLSYLLQDDNEIEGVILSVCDQPYLTEVVFSGLLETALRTGKDIVASSYADTLGVPAFVSKNRFQELRALNGHQGAKVLFEDKENLAIVAFEKGNVDIDTSEEYDRLGNGDLL